MTDEYQTISSKIGEDITPKRSKFSAFAHHVTSVDQIKRLWLSIVKIL